MPPDGDSDCDKGKEAQPGNAPYGYGKWNGDVDCAESGEECQFGFVSKYPPRSGMKNIC